MLSPGQFHKLLPKHDLVAMMRLRIAILKACSEDKQIAAGILEMCRQDIIFWMCLFVYQYNPLKKIGDQDGPFIPWDFQELAVLGGDEIVDGQRMHRWGILECVDDQKDARWQKSREIGASWLVLLVILWLCLFHPNVIAICLSQDQDKVDKGTNRTTLFAKLDFVLERLPNWMTGGFKTKAGVGVYRVKLEYQFALTGSTISGEATTKASGVSARATLMLVDEFGQFTDGATTFDDTADTSYCRIFVGTHRDTCSMFYTLCFDPLYKDMREILTHWSQHPEKRRGLYRYDPATNQVIYLDRGHKYDPDFAPVMDGTPVGGPFPCIRSPWYDNECKRRGAKKRGVQMNLDIDPMGASDRFFEPMQINLLIAKWCRAPVWVGILKHDRDGRAHELIETKDGKIKLWVHPRSSRAMPSIRAAGGLDISTGTGKSPHCLSLCDVMTGMKFLEYIDDDIYQPELAEFVCALCRMIVGPDGELPMLCWETQFAMVFRKRLMDDLGYGYGNVHIPKSASKNPTPGINAGSSDLIVAIHELYRDDLNANRVINQSEHALKETLKMVYVKKSVVYKTEGKAEENSSGVGVFHGDIVRADAMMNMVRESLASRLIEAKKEEETQIGEVLTFAGRQRMRMRERQEQVQWV